MSAADELLRHLKPKSPIKQLVVVDSNSMAALCEDGSVWGRFEHLRRTAKDTYERESWWGLLIPPVPVKQLFVVNHRLGVLSSTDELWFLDGIGIWKRDARL